MVEKCKQCGAKIIRFPLWRGQEQGEKFAWSKIIWINLFKMNIESLIMFVLLTVLILSYKHDVAKCDEVIDDPCGFCINAPRVCDYGITMQLEDAGVILPNFDLNDP